MGCDLSTGDNRRIGIPLVSTAKNTILLIYDKANNRRAAMAFCEVHDRILMIDDTKMEKHILPYMKTGFDILQRVGQKKQYGAIHWFMMHFLMITDIII